MLGLLSDGLQIMLPKSEPTHGGSRLAGIAQVDCWPLGSRRRRTGMAWRCVFRCCSIQTSTPAHQQLHKPRCFLRSRLDCKASAFLSAVTQLPDQECAPKAKALPDSRQRFDWATFVPLPPV